MNRQPKIAIGEQFLDIALHVGIFVTILLAVSIFVAYRLRTQPRYSLLFATVFGLLLCPIVVGIARVYDISALKIPVPAIAWDQHQLIERADGAKLHGPRMPIDNTEVFAFGDQNSSLAPLTAHEKSTRSQVFQADHEHPASMIAGSTVIESESISLWSKTATIFFYIWMIGFSLFLARFLCGWLWVHRIVKSSATLDPSVSPEAVHRVREYFLPQRLPVICESSSVQVPLAVGIIRPVVIIPRGIGRQLSVDELTAILIHECAHVFRRDCLVGSLQKFLEAVYWFHPLYFVMCRLMGRTREEICDNYVLSQMPARGYAQLLLKLTTQIRTSPPTAAVPLLLRGWSLEDRVKGLFDADRRQQSKHSNIQRTAIVASVLLTVLAFAPTRFVTAQNSREAHEAAAPRVNSALVNNADAIIATENDPQSPLPTRRVAFSPDGSLLAACFGEPNTAGMFRVWSWRTGKLILEHKEPFGICDCSFSPDGSTIAIGMYAKVAKLLSLQNGEVLLEFTGHESHVRNVAFVNKQTLATGSYDKSVRLWEIASGGQVAVLGRHDNELRSVVASPDGNYLLTGATSPDCRLWSIRDLKQIAEYSESDAICPNVIFSKDGRYLLSARWDAKVRIRDAETQNLLAAITAYSIRGLDLSPDNRFLMACADQPTLNMIPVRLDAPDAQESARIVELIKLWSDDDFEVREKASRELIAMGMVVEPFLRGVMKFESAELRLRARRARAAIMKPEMIEIDVGHQENVGTVAFALDNVHIASGDVSGVVKVWRITDRNVVASFSLRHTP